ncbi:transferase [Trichoderma sp. SZMC 28013]
MDWEYLSPLDQILPRMYFGEILCFPSTDTNLFQLLQQGLSKVAASVPHLTSFVVHDDARPGNLRLERGRDSIDNILVYGNDPLEKMPDYENLKRNSFPVFPQSSLFYPNVPNVSWAAPWPVMRAEVTRVRGGFVLVVLVHHCVFDGVALSELLNLWAICCARHTSAQPPEISQARLNRKVLQGEGLKQQSSPPADIFKIVNKQSFLSQTISLIRQAFNPILPKPLSPTWPITLYRLPHDKLQSLKQTLNQFAPRFGVRFLSTNDVVSALIWSCATMAMSTSFQRWNLMSYCSTGVSVNIRPRIQPRLPDDFIGCAIGVAYVDMARTKLCAAAEMASFESLARVAAAIRHGVDGITNEKMREILNYVDGPEDPRTLQWRPKKLNEFYISSWANQCIYDADWGPHIGKCEALRVAQIALAPMCVILPPRQGLEPKDGQSGDIELVVSLESLHMDRFRRSKAMSQFAEIIDC